MTRNRSHLSSTDLPHMSMPNLSHGKESHLRTIDGVRINTDQGIVGTKIFRRTDKITNPKWEEHRVAFVIGAERRNAYRDNNQLDVDSGFCSSPDPPDVLFDLPVPYSA